jgi:hypothetical protein
MEIFVLHQEVDHRAFFFEIRHAGFAEASVCLHALAGLRLTGCKAWRWLDGAGERPAGGRDTKAQAKRATVGLGGFPPGKLDFYRLPTKCVCVRCHQLLFNYGP